MFGFVGHTAKLDDSRLYDTYVNLVSPLQMIGEVLRKTIQYFGWRYVALFGSSSDVFTWAEMDELWTSVENQLKIDVIITAKVRYNTKDQSLHKEKLSYVSSVARSKFQRREVYFKQVTKLIGGGGELRRSLNK